MLSFQKFKFLSPLMNDTLSHPPSLSPSFLLLRVKRESNQRQGNVALEQTKNNTEEEDWQNNNP